MVKCLVLIIPIAYLSLTQGAPVDLINPPQEIFDFMRTYGYLGSKPSDSEALYSEDAVIAAIKNVQKFGAINETGMLDNATLKLMRSPRCGVADIPSYGPPRNRKKRYVVGSISWQKRNITYFIANWSHKVGEEKVAAHMATAFQTWAQYGNLKFQRVYDPSADIIVAFGAKYHGDGYPFDGPGNILAHAFYPYEMNSYGGDIHFDDDENWLENAKDLSEGVDFLTVAVHELGHSLGLAHSFHFSAIMFPYYKGPGQSANLDYDDIMGMYKLYIATPLESDKWVSYPDGRDEDKTTEMTTQSNIFKDDFPVTTPTSDTNDANDADLSPTKSATEIFTFEGDYNTIEQHRVTNGIVPVTKPKPLKPDICYGHFDAVAVLRTEIFIFKDSYIWILTEKYRIKEGYPVTMHQIFPGLPKVIQHIDAAYERNLDGNIVLFSGKFYYEYDGFNFTEPRPITDYGIDENVTKIDAVTVWDKNTRLYLFSKDQFWRYDDELRRLDDDYPKNIQRWRGVPSDLDAAVTTLNGKTYFFKENMYWLFNNRYIRTERGYPRWASNAWLGCPLMPRRKY